MEKSCLPLALRHVAVGVAQADPRIVRYRGHARVPFLPSQSHGQQTLWVTVAQIRALAFVEAQVEEVIVVIDSQVLPVTVAVGPLLPMILAPLLGPFEPILSVVQQGAKR